MGRTNKTGVDWNDKQSINQHLTLRRAEKRQEILEDENYVSPKTGRPKIRTAEEVRLQKKLQDDKMIECIACSKMYRKRDIGKHERTLKHINNVKKQTSFI